MTQAARQESAVGEISTLLGRGSEFEGKLTFEGTVRIDGVLKGEVFSEDVLIVGEGARVEAEIDVGAIIIQGTSLQIEKGVIFEGRSFMESFHNTDNKPKSMGPSKSPPKPEANKNSGDTSGPKPVK